MSVRRRQNFISQMRVDVPHMRSIESAVSNDFDELLKGFVSGSTGYVLRGFEINMTGTIGGAAAGLQLIVSDGCIFHTTSSESGTFYVVPSGTVPEILNSTINTKVSGAFTPDAVNYVGIEYERIVDDTTSDQVYVWDPTNKNEITKIVPLAKILRYKIVITTTVWASNVLPIAKVTTNAANNVSDITDQRAMLFRLGSAGYNNPNPAYEYAWTNQSEGRSENPSTSTSNSTNPFRGGDKMIYSLKEWMDAIMTSFKEIKGTTYWYSENTGGSIVGLRADLGNSVFTGTGSVSHSSLNDGLINWNSDIYLKFIGGDLSYKIESNAATTDIELEDDEVAYVKLVRDQVIVPNLIWTGGSAVVASVGAVSWTGPLEPGDWVKLATSDITQYYQVSTVDSTSQVTLTSNFLGISTGLTGAKSQYTFGVYRTDPAPSTDRHIKIAARGDVPFDEDHFWIMLRADNGGVIPRVYVRFIAAELQQGEEREINDNASINTLTYIGATSEVDTDPNYTSTTVITQGGSLTQALGEVDQELDDINAVLVRSTDITVLGATDQNVNIEAQGIGEVALLTNGSARLTVKDDGKVGIGTVTPSDELEVVGTIRSDIFSSNVSTNSQTGSNVAITTPTTSFLLLTGALTSINEIVAGAEGQILVLTNATGSNVVVYNETGTAANRIRTGTGGAISLLNNASLLLMYDTTNSRWFVVGGVGGSSTFFASTSNAAIQAGNAVYVDNGGTAEKIDALTDNTIEFVGIALDAGGGSIRIQTTGEVEIDSALIDGGGPFIIGKPVYCSDAVSGNLTSNIPTLSGRWIIPVGIATGDQTLVINGAGSATAVKITSGDDAYVYTSVVSVGANTTLTNGNSVVLVNASTGTKTITLPSPTSGKIFNIKKIDSSANAVTITPPSGTIDGAGSKTLAVQYDSLTIASDGTNFFII